MLSTKNTNDAHLTQTKACEIIALDSQNRPIVRIKYLDCVINTMEGVQMASDDTGSKVISSTVTLRYNVLEVVDSEGSQIGYDYRQ